MKMVDGSTVRHGRVDCSYRDRVSAEGRVTTTQEQWGETRKEKREETVMKREEERRKRGRAVVRIRHTRTNERKREIG